MTRQPTAPTIAALRQLRRSSKMTRGRASEPAPPLGGAAAATEAGADAPPAQGSRDARQRRYRLRAGESVADGIRRVAGGELAGAADKLAGADEAALEPAVHDARKAIKRVRAALRLSRGAIDERVPVREHAELRAIAGRLSSARDARVLTETLGALERRSVADLPAGATAELRARLHDEHERARAELQSQDAARVAAEALARARARTAEWAFANDDFPAIEPGLQRIYRSGRRRLRAARAQPSAERLHDCRKRVKDLWHVAELLHPAHPKRLKRLSRRARELADLLGDHHDLSVLRAYVEVHPQHFADAASRDALLAVIERDCDALQRRALKRAGVIYKRRPKRFVADVERDWRRRAEGR